MIYTIDTLPTQVLQLDNRLQKVWLTAYQIACEKSADTILASRVGWDVVKRVANNPIQEFSLYITKANIDASGKMQFRATASDTKPDTYRERMSLDLFRGFIEKFNGQEYVSLAHYPRLKSKLGEVGLLTKIYLDGDYLKICGFFHDTKLGKECYQSILDDRTNDIPENKRVRVSIGFYDRLHKHMKSGAIWDYESGKPCYKCLLGSNSDKVYLRGLLEHCALTRVPANKRTDIEPVEENNL